jgi:hypothetical protein
VTGGGGGTLQPIAEAGCSSSDAYGLGWSPTKLRGSRCGSAPLPDSASRVFHFLLVHIDGSTVTVTPTDELGRTFDVQTYTFSAVPDTVIDSAPAPSTNSKTATFAFHATQPGATFMCTLDGGAPQSCTSPTTYSQLADGSHTFSVDARTAAGADPTAATSAWTIDTVAPSPPSALKASAPSSALVNLSWTAATDNRGVASNAILRNGSVVATVDGNATSYSDTTVSAGTTYTFQVVALDAAGNQSSPSNTATVTTPGAAPPVFADNFEAGNLSAWTSSAGLSVENTVVHGGAFAAEGNTTNGGTYAKKTLPASYTDAYSRVWFNVQSASSQVNLLRYRTVGDASIAYLYITTSGQLGLRNDAGATTTLSTTFAPPGSGWHELELHTLINGATSTVEVWLDGSPVNALSFMTNLGTAPVGRLQIGEVQSGRTYDVVFDDAAFATQRIGP